MRKLVWLQLSSEELRILGASFLVGALSSSSSSLTCYVNSQIGAQSHIQEMVQEAGQPL